MKHFGLKKEGAAVHNPEKKEGFGEVNVTGLSPISLQESKKKAEMPGAAPITSKSTKIKDFRDTKNPKDFLVK